MSNIKRFPAFVAAALFLFLLTLILKILTVFYSNQPVNRKITITSFTKKKNCNEFSLIFDQFSNKNQFKIIEDYNLTTKFLSWNRSPLEPQVIYPAQNSITLKILNKNPDEAKKIIENLIEKKLKNWGYELDHINSYKVEKNLPEKYRIAYKNDQIAFLIEYSQEFNFSEQKLDKNTLLHLTCGEIKNPQLDALYNEIIPIVKEVYSSLKKDDVVMIDKNINNLYYEVRIPFKEGTGGWYPIGIIRKNGKLMAIWQGWHKDPNGVSFSEPLCSDLEKNGAPPGITCVELTPVFKYRKTFEF